MEAEAGEDLPRARLERVAAQLVEAGLRLPEALDELVELVAAGGVGQGVLERVELLGRLGDLAGAGHRLGYDAPPLHLADVLAEVPDGDAAIDGDRPSVRLLLLHDHAKRWSTCRIRSDRQRPTFSPLKALIEASRKRICLPCCLEIWSSLITGGTRA